ncbi:hypothetical protein [Bosea sp. BIWAKO-01]|uniref:hypothetical protein n=1 Tax=Bosea sp. BIWAKO-01 TaxID=506668 RepID=UPI00086C0DD3|nr:hypothetical protein [Bosea sp. BIWAKO-01]GAU82938.1 hypothetical protein BIWAKO_02861 [Bosea sp. BIWAKO-01]
MPKKRRAPKRMKELEAENARLRRAVADLTLETRPVVFVAAKIVVEGAKFDVDASGRARFYAKSGQIALRVLSFEIAMIACTRDR